MATFFAIVLAIPGVFSQTYYVTSSGSDSTSSGSQGAPCATINQVLSNYPGVSCSVSIGAGTFATTAIILSRDAVVVFQGTGNPTINASWSSDSFITNTATSGFEFHDLSITLSGSGVFTELDYATNAVVFENVVLSYSVATNGGFVSVNGGSVAFGNVSIINTNFVSYYLIVDFGREDSNITFTGSTFTNLTFDETSAFLEFRAKGVANIVVDSSSFNGITTGYGLISVWSEDTSQIVNITKNTFSNIDGYLPSVYIENDNQASMYVSNSTWTNCTSGFVSGALETLGCYNTGVDHNITLNNLVFINCSGPLAGAVLVAYNSLNLSGSNFSANSGQYGNDLVHGVDSNSSRSVNVTDSFSSSALPKAVVQDLSNGTLTDISDLLPDPKQGWPFTVPESALLHLPLTRKDVSAPPRFKFGRKPAKHTNLESTQA